MTPDTILVIDDELMTRDIIEGFLYPDGYELAFASSGAEAMEMLSKTEPDLILLDILMPDMDGFEVCRRIKANAQWRHIPIIIVTALQGKNDVIKGFEAGADDFIHKPFNDIELRARVRAMLRRKKRQDQIQASGIE